MAHRVLVVDDDDDMREVLGLVLTDLGYDVRAAATGPDALEIAADWRPGVALLDIGLPGMDGYGVARALRPLDPSLRIVALSGSEPLDPNSAFLFDAHALKPFGIDTLVQTLEDMILRTNR
jgi:two-component system, sensor histidine kinase